MSSDSERSSISYDPYALDTPSPLSTPGSTSLLLPPAGSPDTLSSTQDESSAVSPLSPTILINQTARSAVWSHPEFRKELFSYLRGGDRITALLLSRGTFPEAVKALYHSFKRTHKPSLRSNMMSIAPDRQSRYHVYLSAIHHLTVNAREYHSDTMASQTCVAQIAHHPNLRTLSYGTDVLDCRNVRYTEPPSVTCTSKYTAFASQLTAGSPASSILVPAGWNVTRRLALTIKARGSQETLNNQVMTDASREDELYKHWQARTGLFSVTISQLNIAFSLTPTRLVDFLTANPSVVCPKWLTITLEELDLHTLASLLKAIRGGGVRYFGIMLNQSVSEPNAVDLAQLLRQDDEFWSHTTGLVSLTLPIACESSGTDFIINETDTFWLDAPPAFETSIAAPLGLKEIRLHMYGHDVQSGCHGYNRSVPRLSSIAPALARLVHHDCEVYLGPPLQDDHDSNLKRNSTTHVSYLLAKEMSSLGQETILPAWELFKRGYGGGGAGSRVCDAGVKGLAWNVQSLLSQ